MDMIYLLAALLVPVISVGLFAAHVSTTKVIFFFFVSYAGIIYCYVKFPFTGVWMRVTFLKKPDV